MIDLFTFWVIDICGSSFLSLLLTGLIFAFICIMGKMSFPLMFTMMSLYFLVFGVLLFSSIIWMPIFIFSIIYFFLQGYKLTQE